MRKTIIIATLGPATDNLQTLEHLILSGVDIVRINMSHGNNAINAVRIKNAQDIAKKINKRLDIFVDLQGPKVRIGKFINKKINLKVNSKLILDPDLDHNAGTDKAVYVSYPDLYKDLNLQDLLLLDDGKIELQVELIRGNKIFCVAKNEGVLSNNKGINIQGGGLSLNAITNQDKQDILFASQLGVDFFGLSFVKTAADINDLYSLIKYAKSRAKVFAKIETKQSIINLEEITKAADGVMVARGDLAVELGFAKLPALQKKIIQVAKYLNKPCLVATQMMESMIENSIPTRAEVMDVANSIIDGAKGLVLSAETAIGKHPPLVIKYVNEICLEAEKLIT
jgi:pyruvate kinase